MSDVDYPEGSNKPYIQFNHIDGPMLTCSDGSIHWLTLTERMLLRIGLLTIEQLDTKYRKF